MRARRLYRSQCTKFSYHREQTLDIHCINAIGGTPKVGSKWEAQNKCGRVCFVQLGMSSSFIQTKWTKCALVYLFKPQFRADFQSTSKGPRARGFFPSSHFSEGTFFLALALNTSQLTVGVFKMLFQLSIVCIRASQITLQMSG